MGIAAAKPIAFREPARLRGLRRNANLVETPVMGFAAAEPILRKTIKISGEDNI
jgi:hypothetical protein